ncbi:MFS transporter [Streptomyces sp. NPDC088812]|uniref:MFS transporter n=1 Tax=Streptomyces sp. NPDC088812 TaxID=3365905 RepID=UPI0037F80E0D
MTADSAYGQEWRFRRLLEETAIGYVLTAPKSQQVPRFGRIDHLFTQAPDEAWEKRSCGAGAKGPRVYHWAAVQLPVTEDIDDDRAHAAPGIEVNSDQTGLGALRFPRVVDDRNGRTDLCRISVLEYLHVNRATLIGRDADVKEDFGARVGSGGVRYAQPSPAMPFRSGWLRPGKWCTLANRVEEIDPAHKESRLSLVLGVGAVVGLLSNPVLGRLSDRTTSRFGMRRPWLLGSALIGVLGLALVGVSHTLAGVLAGWCVVQAAFTTMLATMLALLPDHVAPRRRGLVSGILGMCQALATVVGIGLANGIGPASPLAFIAPGVLALVAVVWLVAVLPDRRLDPADRPAWNLSELLRSYWVSPARHPDFGWTWLSRFLLLMAVAAVLNYQVYYLRDQLGLNIDDSNRMVGVGVGVQTVLVVIGSNLFGWLSDRLGRRRIFVILAACLSAVSLLILAVGTSIPLFVLAMALGGLGQGVYFAVDMALVTEVLPDSRGGAAKDLGVINIATVLPQSVAPALAPALLAVGAGHNYTATVKWSAGPSGDGARLTRYQRWSLGHRTSRSVGVFFAAACRQRSCRPEEAMAGWSQSGCPSRVRGGRAVALRRRSRR